MFLNNRDGSTCLVYVSGPSKYEYEFQQCSVVRSIPSNSKCQASNDVDQFQKPDPSNDVPVRNFVDIKTLFLTAQAQ